MSEYDALLTKVASFTESAAERRADDMQCRRGCDACCHVALSVSPVEAASVRAGLAALSERQRSAIRERAERTLAAHEEPPRCVMLEADGGCAIYASRPLVCRTQGHALRYPPGFVPERAVRLRAAGGEITWCPLNFTERAPASADVLDAERVDQILALVSRRYADQRGRDPLQRESLAELAASPEPDALC